MNIITVGNITSKLDTNDPKLLRAIMNELSFKVPGCEFSPAYKSGRWNGKEEFFSLKTSTFDTGLLFMVEDIVSEFGQYHIQDTREFPDVEVPPEITLGGGITLREYQHSAVESAINQMRGIVNIATNGGKTEIASGIIQTLLESIPEESNIAFFTFSKEIFTQSHKRLQERLGIPIGMIGNNKFKPERVSVVMVPTLYSALNSKKASPTKEIKDQQKVVENIKELVARNQATKKDLSEARKVLKDMENRRLAETLAKKERAINYLKSLGCLIIDEAHHTSSDTAMKVFRETTNCVYRFGLTGTVNEDNVIDAMKLRAVTGDIVSKVRNDFLIEEGHSAKPIIYMVSFDTDFIDYGDYMMHRRDGVINNDERNSIIASLCTKRMKEGKQCLIIVNETEHGEILEDYMSDCGFNVAFSHGERTDKFRQDCLDNLRNGEVRTLIATTILDEGVDVSGINCLFIASGGKSYRQILQRVGRGLRKKSDGSGLEVYDFLDLHSDYLIQHTHERHKTYSEEGFDIKKMVIGSSKD